MNKILQQIMLTKREIAETEYLLEKETKKIDKIMLKEKLNNLFVQMKKLRKQLKFVEKFRR